MPTFTGTINAETINGSAGDDVIDGRGGNDQLNGLDGADRFLLGFGGYGGERPGSPIIDGGDGGDQFELNAGLNVTYGRYVQGQDYWEYRTPVDFTLGAGTGGDALFTWGHSITDSRFSPIVYDLNTATLRSIETIVFRFTTAPAYDQRQYGPGGNSYWDESGADRLIISDLSGTSLTGLIDFDGGAGNDYLDSRATANVVLAHGGTQNDVLMSGASNDQLFGDAGDDRLAGGAGANLLDGGTGSDTADYLGATQAVIIDLNDGTVTNNGFGGVDTLTSIENLAGGAFNDVLIGEAGNNRLEGRDGSDYLIGLGGNDILDGGAGAANTLQGGLGDDTYLVRVAGDTVLEYAGEGIDTVFAYVAAYQLRDNFENLTAGGDTPFIGLGNALANIITGGTGADTLSGGGGNDTLYGGTGAANTLVGGAGDDTFYVDAQGDTLVEGAGEGHDTVIASVAYVSLHANIEDLRFTDYAVTGIGNASANRISAQTVQSDDTLHGMGGDDVIEAFAGNDLVSGGAGNDQLDGGTGTDTVTYANAAAGAFVNLTAQIAGNDGDGGTDVLIGFENVVGSAFNDVLLGSSVANVLDGGLGSDTLAGYAGNDILIGGAGAANTLIGGLGDDTYRVAAVGDTLVEAAGEGHDTIEALVNALTMRANIEDMSFIGVGAFTGTGNDTANTITGGVANDLLIGLAGDDRLVGGIGDDTLRGGVGTDTLIGGTGRDTADYSTAAGGVNVRLDKLYAYADGDGGTDSLTGMENVTGSAWADLIGGDELGNVLSGGAGADTLLGFGGNDTLIGGAGAANTMQGGQGDDTYVVQAVGDTVHEEAGQGIDTVLTALASHTLRNNVENLTYTGAGAFTGIGNALANIIEGAGGDDILTGGGGSDQLIGRAGVDTVVMSGLRADYTITGDGAFALITDNVGGRDGVDSLYQIERIRFADGFILELTPPPAAPAAPALAAQSPLAPDHFAAPAGTPLTVWEDLL
jgi:Ca2+-binding RTX toxin-like protein